MANKKLVCDSITLAGVKKTGDKIEKSDFFSFLDQELDLEFYSNIELTDEQARQFKGVAIRLKHGLTATIPIVCTGNRCFAKDLCLFSKEQNYPLTRKCPFESIILNGRVKSWMEDLDVDHDNTAEMSLINELVECEILEHRVGIHLSGINDPEAATLLHTTISESEHATMENLDIHPILEVRDRIHRRKQKILEALAASPREKYKRAAALGNKSDSKDATDLFNELQNIIDTNKTVSKPVDNDSDVMDIDWEITDE